MQIPQNIDIHTHEPNPYARISLVDASSGLTNSCNQDTNVIFSSGIHPCTIPDNFQERAESISQGIQSEKFAAIGECGFDRTSPHEISVQHEVFASLAEISILTNRPMIIHCVHAADLILQYASRMPGEGMWIIHGFRGKPAAMKQLTDAGFSISFGLKANTESVANCPANRIFIETDMAPGNALPEIYDSYSKMRNEDLQTVVNENFTRIFGTI